MVKYFFGQYLHFLFVLFHPKIDLLLHNFLQGCLSDGPVMNNKTVKKYLRYLNPLNTIPFNSNECINTILLKKLLAIVYRIECAINSIIEKTVCEIALPCNSARYCLGCSIDQR
jgi:hypothetical protein